MQEVSGPVIAVVLVMAAVFIPAAFLPGTTGQLYKQFALTIVLSVALSGLVALTLTPAMTALLLKHSDKPQRGFFAAFNRWFERLTKSYGRGVQFIIRRLLVSGAVIAVMVAGIFVLFRELPTSFVPNEDQGYVLGQIIMPDSATLSRTAKTSEQIDAIFAKNPAVANRTIINGFSLIDGQFNIFRRNIHATKLRALLNSSINLHR
jgi:multidrug efflux pump